MWRNYSSASIIYCHDKRVGTFLFGGISGKALCRRDKTESSAKRAKHVRSPRRWISFWIRHGAVKNYPLLWFNLSQPFKLVITLWKCSLKRHSEHFSSSFCCFSAKTFPNIYSYHSLSWLRPVKLWFWSLTIYIYIKTFWHFHIIRPELTIIRFTRWQNC